MCPGESGVDVCGEIQGWMCAGKSRGGCVRGIPGEDVCGEIRGWMRRVKSRVGCVP